MSVLKDPAATLAQWHRNIATCTGMMSGSLARKHYSRRLVQDCLSTLRPIVREMEEIVAAELEQESAPPKIERVRLRRDDIRPKNRRR